MNLLWFLLIGLQSTGEPEALKVDFIETVTVVNLPLRVHKDGEHYKSLDIDELRIVENGVVVTGRDLSTIETPLVVHFLFDLSTSNTRNIYHSKKAARNMVGKMRAGDKSKVSFFSSSYQPLTEYTDNGDELKRSLSLLTPVGSTALYDAIARALDELGRESGSRVLVLFSDGHDLMSHATEARLMARVRNYRIPIVFVKFGEKGATEKPLLKAQIRFMEELASKSGGTVFTGLGANSKALVKCVKKYRQRYVLQFTPPGPQDEEQWRSLVIDIPSCPDCRLEYRRAYSIATMKN